MKHIYDGAYIDENITSGIKELQDKIIKHAKKHLQHLLMTRQTMTVYLLGQWVSETEPMIFIGPDDLPVGIGQAGTDKVSIWIKGRELPRGAA